MPTMIWSRPSRMQNRTITSDTSSPTRAPAASPSHRSPVAWVTTNPANAPADHHPLEPDVEHARLLRDRSRPGSRT